MYKQGKDDNLINIECLECIYKIINAWNVNYVWFVLFQLAKQDRLFKENLATFRFIIMIRFVKIITISVFFGDL